MSLSTALNSAISGLNAAGRASGVVSENIANAMTPGYARRSVMLASRGDVSPGVRFLGVQRNSDPGILANRRAADAAVGAASGIEAFQTRLMQALGQVGDPASLTGRLTEFENALTTAASFPESAQRLDQVALRANDLVGSIVGAADAVQKMRADADRSINVQVNRLNDTLKQVQDLNSRITAMAAGGAETAALQDQRQVLIDEINTMVPVNVVSRDRGQVALYTDGGAILLDGPAVTISFEPVNGIVAEMTIGSGALSGIEINDRPVRTDSLRGALRGGTLGAAFEVRDELGVAVQGELDAVARDLVERFQDPALDATLPAGAAGLFTDNGAAFDSADEPGLAERLKVNAAADPGQGGDSRRLRDGLGAVAPGPVGEARFLNALADTLSSGRTPASGSFGGGSLSADELATTFLSSIAQDRTVAEQRLSFATASQFEMAQAELSQGVDTDAELSNLILIEQSYAANARMIKIVDDLMQTLLRL